MRVTVIGAGLAGCEAAYALAERGIGVDLYDMKPGRRGPAHSSDGFAELVCSNSLRSNRIQNAAGLLKEELRRLGSLVIEAGDNTAVPAGGALAVNRDEFSRYITDKISSHPNIRVIEEHIEALPNPPAIIATGPLTDGGLMRSIEAVMGVPLHFFDAAAPIVTRESLDFSRVFEGSRYDNGSDYINCPMTRDEYFGFVRELQNAETAVLREFEDASVFEGCMPVETMAGRGDMTLAFGPLKPVGLHTPDGGRPFAVVQLRREDAEGRAYNIVGFQTNLKFGEQKRVFSMIPGLENAEFLRFGVMHRNTFLRSPGRLDKTYQVRDIPGLYFAGQITGVEGYIESAASGLTAGIGLSRALSGEPATDFTGQTAIGGLARYVSEYQGGDFQPQNINFGLIDELDKRIRNKRERYEAIAERALCVIDDISAAKGLRRLAF